MAYEKLKTKHTNTIVEFHAVIETNTSEFWIETTLLKQIKADVIFFIHASPSEILRRRMNDKSKQRKITTTEKISELQTKAVDHLIKAYGKEHVIILDEQYAAESITSRIL